MTPGPPELALLVFGPKGLPELGRGSGQGLREFRAGTRELKRDLDLRVKDPDERR